MSDHHDETDPNAAVEHKLVIQQITPTAGPWLAIFDDGNVRPIACWALIACRTHGDSYIAPMVPHDGELADASQIDGYRDSLPEMDEEELEDYLSSPPEGDDDNEDHETEH